MGGFAGRFWLACRLRSLTLDAVRSYPVDLPYTFRPPKPWDWMRPWAVRWGNRTALRKTLRVREVVPRGWERVAELAGKGDSLLLAANHSDHADPYVLSNVGVQYKLRLRFMAARELFDRNAVRTWFLQRMGVFSVDRDGPDIAAIKTAIEILSKGGCPLVVFPEGEIYHHHERLDPLHEGVASIMLRAATKVADERSAWLVPVALRFRHDPAVEESFCRRLSQLEDRIGWKPRPSIPTDERIIRLGTGILSLKEVEYLGEADQGALPERVHAMCDRLLCEVESRRGRDARADTPPERVRGLRYRIRRRLLDEADPPGPREREDLQEDLDRVFTALQAHSYPADYLLSEPSLDRRAETIMKLEEDLLGECDYPAPRTATVVAGEPIPVRRMLDDGSLTPKSSRELTLILEEKLAGLIAAS